MVIIDPDMIYLPIGPADIKRSAEETILAKSFVQTKIDCLITGTFVCRKSMNESPDLIQMTAQTS